MLKTAESFPNGTFAAVRSRSGIRGFTLIELLVVMAIIMILASITFGITRGVQGAQARAKAQGELAVLSQALESFKLRYGDYPWIDGTSSAARNRSMTNALTGRKILVRSSSGATVSLGNSLSDNEVSDTGRPVFIDIIRFATKGSGEDMEITDPWGNSYEYHYKASGGTGTGWQPFGYILYSRGPRDSSLNVNTLGVSSLTPKEIAEQGIMLSGQ
jgi:prepilin-type N-terminal cleavage/methylation domain-containing protein